MEYDVSLKREGMGSDSFPSVTISDACVLDLPEEGLITFRYKRGALVARSATRKEKASASTTLELCKICDFEEAEPEELTKEEETRDSPIDRLFDRVKEDEPEDA